MAADHSTARTPLTPTGEAQNRMRFGAGGGRCEMRRTGGGHCQRVCERDRSGVWHGARVPPESASHPEPQPHGRARPQPDTRARGLAHDHGDVDAADLIRAYSDNEVEVASLPRSQCAATPVDSHLVDRRSCTDRDVLACH